jgi:hypothetical protein
VADKTIPNLVSVEVGTAGAITIFNAFGSTDVVVDFEGTLPLRSYRSTIPTTPFGFDRSAQVGEKGQRRHHGEYRDGKLRTARPSPSLQT